MQIITFDLRDSALAMLKAFVQSPAIVWTRCSSTVAQTTRTPADAILIWQLSAENIEQFIAFAESHRDQVFAILVEAALPKTAIQWSARQGIDFITREGLDLVHWLQQRVRVAQSSTSS